MKCRSSHQRCSLRKGVLRNFAKFTGKHSFLRACNFIKKQTLAQVFSCEFCETSKNTFYRTPPGSLEMTFKVIQIANTFYKLQKFASIFFELSF